MALFLFVFMVFLQERIVSAALPGYDPYCRHTDTDYSGAELTANAATAKASHSSTEAACVAYCLTIPECSGISFVSSNADSSLDGCYVREYGWTVGTTVNTVSVDILCLRGRPGGLWTTITTDLKDTKFNANPRETPLQIKTQYKFGDNKKVYTRYYSSNTAWSGMEIQLQTGIARVGFCSAFGDPSAALSDTSQINTGGIWTFGLGEAAGAVVYSFNGVTQWEFDTTAGGCCPDDAYNQATCASKWSPDQTMWEIDNTDTASEYVRLLDIGCSVVYDNSWGTVNVTCPLYADMVGYDSVKTVSWIVGGQACSSCTTQILGWGFTMQTTISEEREIYANVVLDSKIVLKTRTVTAYVLGCTAGNSNEGCVTCSTGTYSTDGLTCPSCADRKTTDQTGSTTESQCVWSPCDAGEYMTGGGCVNCAAGKYSAAEATSCSDCPVNKWSSVMSESCTACVTGKVSPALSDSIAACTWIPCDAGEYLDDSTGCEDCGVDTWSADAAENSCTNCAEGTVSPAVSPAVSYCIVPLVITGAGVSNHGLAWALTCVYPDYPISENGKKIYFKNSEVAADSTVSVLELDCYRMYIDIGGGDISQPNVADLEECLQACSDMVACRAIAYRISAPYCWLKTDGHSAESNNGDRIAAYKTCFDNPVVDYDKTGSWSCEIAYANRGLHKSVDFAVFIQGITSLEQINKAGSYNDVGESITIKASVIAQAKPTAGDIFLDDAKQGSVTPTFGDADGDGEFPVTFVLPNIQKPGDNTRTIKVKITADTETADIEETMSILVYDRCLVPTVDKIGMLDGSTIDHRAVLEGIACDEGYFINGGQTMSCDDGVNTFSESTTEIEDTKPHCSGITIWNQIVQVDENLPMTCETEDTILPVQEFIWFRGLDVVYNDLEATNTPGYDVVVMEDCVTELGYCIQSDGSDQNAGVTQLDDVSGSPSEMQEACFNQCVPISGASGCEVRLDEQSCFIHTEAIDRGNTAADKSCWVFSKCIGPKSRQGYKKWKSMFYVTGEPGLNANQYYCKAIPTTDPKYSGMFASSPLNTLWIVGIKSHTITGYAGDFIESNKIAGDYSEDYTITFNIYVGPDVASVTPTFTASDGTVTSVTFTAGDTTGNERPYTYSPAEAAKETGVINIEYVYTGFADRTYPSLERVFVFEFCNTAALPTITGTNGGWIIPGDRIDFTEHVLFTCNADYFAEGSSTAKCTTINGTWVIPTIPSCHVKPELICGEFPATDNGRIVYINTTHAKYECYYGYNMLGEDKVYGCSEITHVWTAAVASNPTLTVPVCQGVAEAESRGVSIYMEFDIDVGYCNDEAEIENFKTTLENNLKSTDLAICLTISQCEIADFTCVYDSSNSELDVRFILLQVFDLRIEHIITEDFMVISVKQLTPNDITFDLLLSTLPVKRGAKQGDRLDKRLAGTVTVTANLVQAAIVLSCPEGTINQNETCVECPAGYGIDQSGVCQVCPIGSYTTDPGIVPCTVCPSGDTTKSTGSKVECDCYTIPEVCITKEPNEHGVTFPPPGTKAEPNTVVTMFCTSGYALAHGVSYEFECSREEYPECYRICSLDTYTAANLKERHIYNNPKRTHLVHGEEITVVCQKHHAFEDSYYEHHEEEEEEDEEEEEHDYVPSRTLVCHGDGTVGDAVINFGVCEEKLNSTVIFGLLVGVIVLALIAILLCVLNITSRKKPKKRRSGKQPAQQSYVGNNNNNNNYNNNYNDNAFYDDNAYYEGDNAVPAENDMLENFKISINNIMT